MFKVPTSPASQNQSRLFGGKMLTSEYRGYRLNLFFPVPRLVREREPLLPIRSALPVAQHCQSQVNKQRFHLDVLAMRDALRVQSFSQ